MPSPFKRLNMGIPIIGEDIQLIGEDGKKRAEKCLHKIQKILERYDCVLIPVITIVGTRIVAAMDVQPKVRKVPPPNPN